MQWIQIEWISVIGMRAYVESVTMIVSSILFTKFKQIQGAMQGIHE